MSQTTQTTAKATNTLDANAIRHGNPSVHVHQPKKDIRLVFSNYTNTEYDVVEDDLQVPQMTENYADVFRRGLDPNINNKQVYGVAPGLKPKTALINKMRVDIDKATAELNGFIDDEKQRIAEFEKIASANKDTPAPTPAPTSDQGGNQ